MPEKSGPADPREPRPAGRSLRWPDGPDFMARAGSGEGSGFGVGFDFSNNGPGLCCIPRGPKGPTVIKGFDTETLWVGAGP